VILQRLAAAAALALVLSPASFAATPEPKAETRRRVAPEAYARYCVAIQHIQAGRLRDAVDELEAVIKADPKATPAHVWLGILYDERLRPRQPDAARKHFEAALAIDPQSFRARLGMARQLLRQSLDDKAREHLLIAIKSPEARSSPGLLATAHFELAKSAEDAGQFDKAIQHYRKAVRGAVNRAYVLLRLGRVCRAAERYDESVDALLRLTRRVPTYAPAFNELYRSARLAHRWPLAFEAIQAYMTHRRGPGEQTHLLKEAAEVAERARRPAKARELRERLLARLKQLHPPEKADAAANLEIAGALVALGRTKDALPYLEQAVAKASDRTRPLMRLQLAKLYRRLDRADDAVKQLGQAIGESEPGSSVAFHVELAETFEKMKRYDDAEKTLAKLLEIPGEKASAHAELGLFFKRRGAADKSVKHLRLAVKNAEQRAVARYTIQLSLALESANQIEEAERVLVEAIRARPDDPALNNALGWFYAERGIKLDRAYELVTKAVKARPRNAFFIDSLGWVYFKKGKEQKALMQLLRAAAIEENSVFCDHLGDVYLKLGQPENAVEQWRRSLELDPDIKGVREKIEKLKP
jgi:tetratricopeptide (TPR) repeat protein